MRCKEANSFLPPCGNGFWFNFRRSDDRKFKEAVKVQRLRKKMVRCELAIQFLVRCRDAGVYPKFSRWKNANNKDPRTRDRYRRKVLLDEIRAKHLELRAHKTTVAKAEEILYNGTPRSTVADDGLHQGNGLPTESTPTQSTRMTFIKKTVIRWSINPLNEAERPLVQRTQPFHGAK